MCGIVGTLLKNENAINESIAILKKLEYRGYDSCGIAFFDINNEIKIVKSVGKINELDNKLKKHNYNSRCAIAHTRWATHGEVNETNTHPHFSENVVLIQNGIIENYQQLKSELIKDNYEFYSTTDTEVLVKLIDKYYQINNKDILKTIKKVKEIIIGNYSVLFMLKDKPNELFGFCNNTPFIIAKDALNQFYVSSDVNSISQYIKNNEFYFLDKNEFLHLSINRCDFFDLNSLQIIDKKPKLIKLNQIDDFNKNGYDHFMLKEINEQSKILKSLIDSHYVNQQINFAIDSLNEDLIKNIKYIRIIGCGSAFNSGLVGKYFFESFNSIKTEVLVASEFRYEKFIQIDNCLNIIISQSGETADTLACLHLLKDHNEKILAIVNVRNSSIANLASNVIYMNCGNEYSVASTKAYTAQTLILILISLKLITNENLVNKLINELYKDIDNLNKLISIDKIESIAKKMIKFKNIIFIGRSLNYYLAIEAALKLKEISYLNVAAYPAGELKHGPISLIDKDSITIGLIYRNDELTLKTISNINEIKTREGTILLIAPNNIKDEFLDNILTINNQSSNSVFSFYSTIYLFQLLAYYVAKTLGNDIDNPKNLAKSVTVE